MRRSSHAPPYGLLWKAAITLAVSVLSAFLGHFAGKASLASGGAGLHKKDAVDPPRHEDAAAASRRAGHHTENSSESPETDDEALRKMHLESLARLKYADLSRGDQERLTGDFEKVIQRSFDEAMDLYFTYAFSGEQQLANMLVAMMTGTSHRDDLDFNGMATRLMAHDKEISPWNYASLASFQVAITSSFPHWIKEIPEQARGLALECIFSEADTVDLGDANYSEIIASFGDPQLKMKMMNQLLMTGYEAEPAKTLADTLANFDSDDNYAGYVEAITARWKADDPVGLINTLGQLRADPVLGARIEHLRSAGTSPTLNASLTELQAP